MGEKKSERVLVNSVNATGKKEKEKKKRYNLLTRKNMMRFFEIKK